MIPATTQRVQSHTADAANQQIQEQMREDVASAAAGGPDTIRRRLEALKHEWDIERTLEANASTLVVVGSLLALVVNRKFAFVPLVVGGFLLQHAIQGWCPPLAIFRRLGVRTAGEINRERAALKAIRGDFQSVSHEGGDAQNQARRALDAAASA